ncbi:MAG: ketoacyl-ACP synthase III [Planctomycetes bacterium]|nr:ketoacyl-ACP synthase III [Planctomycetota bacterium]
MTAVRRVGIRGTGACVPERVLSNDDLQKMVDTSDEWITTRTGIKERRIIADDKATSDLAIEASEKALADAGISAADLDMIIVATISSDYVIPSTACLLQSRLKARHIGAFDIQAACSGFIYAVATAQKFIESGSAHNVLVVGAEALSRVTDYQDRASCILFGDGAGAVILSDQFERGEILSVDLHADGDGEDFIKIKAGGSRHSASHQTVDGREHYMRVRGRDVYRFAVSRMVELVESARQRHPDVALGLVIPHQVNLRIIESARDRLGLQDEQVYVNIDRFGNTSSASIPIGLDEARRAGRLDGEQGKLLVMCAFGAGLTWGAVSLKW